MSRKPSSEELARYVRSYVLEQKDKGATWAAIGKTLGLGHSRVIQIANPAKYGDVRVGVDVLQALAERLHEGSLDALYAAAADYAAKHPVVQLPVDGYREARYDSRESAIQTHVRYGEYSVEAIREAANAVAVALDAEEDPGERWWYEQIDAELKRRRRGKPRLGQREIIEDDEPRRELDVRHTSASADLDQTLDEAAAALGKQDEEDRSEDLSSSAKIRRASKPSH